MTRVKICGVRDIGTAAAAARAGADFIGLVFAPGRRQVAEDKARAIVEAVKKVSARVEAVGVFVDPTAGEVDRIARYCLLDRVQLSGSETPSYCAEIKYPVVKAIHIHRQMEALNIMTAIEDYSRHDYKHGISFLLDTSMPDIPGGTGQTFDWEIARAPAASIPVMVAGGLNPENVMTMIKLVRPWGVDVSTGVETDGVKDVAKIKRFIQSVKEFGGDNLAGNNEK